MPHLTLFKSYLYDSYFKSLSNNDCTLLLNSGLRGASSSGYFKLLTTLFNKYNFLIAKPLLEQLLLFDDDCDGIENVCWYCFEPFFDKRGEFYSLLFCRYEKAFVKQMFDYCDACPYEELKMGYLHNLFDQCNHLIEELSVFSFTDKSDIFLHRVVLNTLLAIYVQMRNSYKNYFINNPLTNAEIEQLITSGSAINSYLLKDLTSLFEKGDSLFHESRCFNSVSTGSSIVLKRNNFLKKELKLKPGQSSEDLLSSQDCYNYLNMSKSSFNRLVAGRLTSIKKGKFNCYRRGDLIAYYNEHLR